MIHTNNFDHGKRIAFAIPRNYNPAVDPVISHTDKDGNLLGGVIYEGHTGSIIFAHQAGFSKHWMSRDMLCAIFGYPFHQLKVKKICGTIPSSSPELLAFNLKLGFKVEAVIKDGYPHADLLVMSMTRDECRFLAIKPRSLGAAPT